MTIGDNLRRLRKARDWTQQELAGRSGVTQGIITNIEKGRTPNPTAQTVQRLAAALGVSADALLDTERPPIDTSAPPVDLWHALRWPEKLIKELVEDWPDYSEAERAHLIQQAEETLQVVSQRQRRAAG